MVGEPGIGKTRLANELIALVEKDATVLTGRCISYGEGATYLPLREMVERLDLGADLAEAEEDEFVAERVLSWSAWPRARQPAARASGPSAGSSGLARERPLLSRSRTSTGQSRRCSS